MKNNKASSMNSKFFATFAALMLGAVQADAASVVYILDQSNALPDGVPYLQVTVADGTDGAIDFTVEPLAPLSDLASDNFGIQSFAFNVAPGGDAESADVTNLPEGWTARDKSTSRMSSFGFFDIKVFGGGNSRLDVLTFSLNGIDGDSISDYTILSTGHSASGQQFFAAHVASFAFDCDTDEKGCLTSAFVGGSAVPLPATAWLFGTGILGAVLRARRRK